ncbi:MAG: N-acetyltransferase family protein, partial [Gammaproteobacteria bacterium]
MSKLAELRADVREMGGVGWSAYATDRLLDRLSAGRARLWAFRFYAQPIPDRPLLAPSRSTRLRIGVVRPGEIDSRRFERPAGAVEERFAAGSTCIAAVDGEELAGFMWLHFGRLRERLLACDFEPLPSGRTCWDYDFEVFPRFRLGRTFARLWDETYQLLRERGVEASVSWISFSNRASQRAHERMGAQPIGWLAVLELFGYKLAAQSNRPYVRLAAPGRRLHVRVDARLQPDG